MNAFATIVVRSEDSTRGLRLSPKWPSSLRVKRAESVEWSVERSALNSRTAVFTRSDEGYLEGLTLAAATLRSRT